jgi:hypothetical protein
MLTASATMNRTTIGRWLGAATAALALLLLVGGVTATPAGAAPRNPSRDNANNFEEWCWANGGEPWASPSGSGYAVQCTFSDGSSILCSFSADGTASCHHLDANDNILGDVPPPNGCKCGTAPPLMRPPSGPGQPGGPVQTGGTPLPNPGGVQTGGTPLTVATAGGDHGRRVIDRHCTHGHGKVPTGNHRHGGKK